LDLLLHLYATDFRDALAETNRSGHGRKSSLLTACDSFLIAVCEDEQYNTAGVTAYVKRHPLYALWTIHPGISLFSSSALLVFEIQKKSEDSLRLDSERLLKRREAWNSMISLDMQGRNATNVRWVCWRITSIYDMMSDVSRASLYENGTKYVAFDAFVDLMIFVE